MQIKKVVGENFLSFERFELSLADRGLLGVEGENCDLGGSNGSGKSSLLEALPFCFFNITTRGIKGDSVVRCDRNGKAVGNTSVITEIENDGNEIIVARHRKHKVYGNKMLLTVNGSDLTMPSDKETQLRLQEMLQIDYDSFVSAVLYPQGAVGFPALADAEQKAILEQVLAVRRFSEALERTKSKLIDVVHEAAAVVDAVNDLRSRLSAAKTNRERLQNNSAAWLVKKADDLAKLQAQIDLKQAAEPKLDPSTEFAATDFEAQLGRADGAAIKNKFDELAGKVAHADRQYAAAEASVRSFQLVVSKQLPSPVSNPGITVDSARQLVDFATHALRTCVDDVDTRKRNLSRTEIELANAQNKKVCGTCGQPLPEDRWRDALTALETRKSQLTVEIAQLERQIGQLKEQYDLAEQKYKASRAFAEYSQALAANGESRKQLDNANSLMRQWAEYHAAIKSSFDAASAEWKAYAELRERCNAALQLVQNFKSLHQTWKAGLEGLRNQHETLLKSTDPFESLISTAADEILKLESNLANTSASAVQYQSRISDLQFWELGFGNRGVKSLLFDTVTPFLTFRGNEYLMELSGNTASMQFHTQKTLASGEQRDKFHVSVSYDGGADDYSALSGGEKRRVDIASLFALGDLGASRSLCPIKLRLLDEPFDNLDSVGAEAVLNILQKLVLPRAGTVLVITHDENLKSMLPNRILVRKRNGISEIVQ